MAAPAHIDEADRTIAAVEQAIRPYMRVRRALTALLIVLAALAAANAARAPAMRVESILAAIGIAALAWRSNLASRRVSFDALLGFARNELARGRFASCERILDHLEAGAPAARMERAVDGLRGENALARGDVDAAVERLRAALAGTESRTLSSCTAALLPAVRGHLALAHALAGEDDAALAAATRIRRMVELRAYGPRVVASVGTVRAMLARASLAEIVVASRRDPASVEPLVAAARVVILEGASPRERALFRAIDRMARARVPSVYRRTAHAPNGVASSGEWIARVLPDAAPFAPGRVEHVGAAEGAPAAAPIGGAVRPAPMTRVAALGALAALVSWALWRIPRDPRNPGDPVPSMVAIALVACATAIAAAFTLRRGARAVRAANEMFTRAATASPGVARAMLASLDVSYATAITRGMTDVALARVARACGDFAAALAHAESAIAVLGDGMTPDATEVTAEAHVERALALASLGRADEARSALDAAPVYFAGRTAAAVAVELFIALRAEDLERARVLAGAVGDQLLLDRRSELVVDLLRGTNPAGGLGLVEMDRIRAELDEPGARAFVDAAAPRLAELATHEGRA